MPRVTALVRPAFWLTSRGVFDASARVEPELELKLLTPVLCAKAKGLIDTVPVAQRRLKMTLELKVLGFRIFIGGVMAFL